MSALALLTFTQHTLSQIINYLKFREERLTVIAEYTKEQAQLEELRVSAEQVCSLCLHSC